MSVVDKYGTGQDPYCYEGTDILINNFDIHDEETLQEAEREFTTAALNDIEFSPPPYDLNYLQELHSLLFSHIYSWAGEIRTIDISKKDTRFCISSRIEPEANKIFQGFEAADFFENEDYESFIVKISELYVRDKTFRSIWKVTWSFFAHLFLSTRRIISSPNLKRLLAGL